MGLRMSDGGSAPAGIAYGAEKLLSDRLVTIRSDSGQKTFALGPGLIISVLACGGALLAWTAFSVGMVIWGIMGLDDPKDSSMAEVAEEIGALASDNARLAELVERFRSQGNAILDLQLSSAIKASQDSTRPVAANSRNGQGGDPSKTRQEFALLALERAIQELEEARSENAEISAAYAERDHEIELQAEKRNRQISGMLELLSSTSTELRSVFRSLGLDHGALIEETQELYSGAGGPSIIESAVDLPSEFEAVPGDPGLDALSEEFGRLALHGLAMAGLPTAHPVKGSSNFTSGFGMRTHPISGLYQMHEGIDYGGRSGTPIQATGNGVISFAGLGRRIRKGYPDPAFGRDRHDLRPPEQNPC